MSSGDPNGGGAAGATVGPAETDAGPVYADGWRQQLSGRWPARPDEPHEHHSAGFWTRDGAQLVVSCCGLDGT